ncbi:MAG: CopG family antitoxin [bacterium]|nr:CopG family antitoxin [bacterium]
MTRKKLPEFRNEKEFVEFVETHSLADYWDEFEPVEDVQIQTHHQAKKRISLQVYPSASRKLLSSVVYPARRLFNAG